MSETDIGSGFTYSRMRSDAGDVVGYFVTGPAGPSCSSPLDGRCGGLVPVVPYRNRPVWTLSSDDPLTLSPSIQCGCNLKHEGQGQHGFITEGRWVNARGIVA